MGIKRVNFELLERVLAMVHNNFMYFKDEFSRSYDTIGMGRPLCTLMGNRLNFLHCKVCIP